MDDYAGVCVNSKCRELLSVSMRTKDRSLG